MLSFCCLFWLHLYLRISIKLQSHCFLCSLASFPQQGCADWRVLMEPWPCQLGHNSSHHHVHSEPEHSCLADYAFHNLCSFCVCRVVSQVNKEKLLFNNNCMNWNEILSQFCFSHPEKTIPPVRIVTTHSANEIQDARVAS